MRDCLFCEIVSGKRRADRILEDDHCLAFEDVHPQAPHHILIIPKIHLASLNEIEDEPALLMHRLMRAAREVAVRLGIDRQGYRLVINTGPYGGQTILHLHMHLLGGRPMQWPPG